VRGVAVVDTGVTGAELKRLGGLQTIHVLQASTERDLDSVFSNLIQMRAGGLVIAADTFFRM
jgi:hypothetical protein